MFKFQVLYNGVYYGFNPLKHSDYSRMFLHNEFIIDVFKVHNHSYYFRAFFYNSKNIYSNAFYRTKKELFCAIHDLLKKELYNVVQF